jgi:hypothetical protein
VKGRLQVQADLTLFTDTLQYAHCVYYFLQHSTGFYMELDQTTNDKAYMYRLYIEACQNSWYGTATRDFIYKADP